MDCTLQIKGGTVWKFDTVDELVESVAKEASKSKISDTEISKITGISQTTISRILGKRTVNPAMSSVIDIVIAIETRVDMR